MKILVCIKAVPEPEHAICNGNVFPEVSIDDHTELRMNRFDEFAVEEAVLIKESFPGTIVDVITMGPENAVKTIKRAIGMGADNGIHILSDYHTSCDAVAVSSCIAKMTKEENYDLILCGIMSEDMMQFSVGPMMAQRLSLPWATSVIKANIAPDNQKIRVERELEGGVKAVIDINLPALLTIQSGINEPRYVGIRGIRKVASVDIPELGAADLGVDAGAIGADAAKVKRLDYYVPDMGEGAEMLTGSTEEIIAKLVEYLKAKGGLK